MFKHLNLPPSLEVRKSTGVIRCMGLFAKKPIERGTRLFSREVHTAGISGYTLNDARSVCHHCLAAIGNTPPVVCRNCRIISYCSNECLEAARPLHTMECNGIIELEKLRGKVTLNIPKPSSWYDDYGCYWPPAHAQLAARVINKGILREDQEASDWIKYVTCPTTLPPIKADVFSQLEEYVRLLVPEEISTQEIQQSLRAISVNAGTFRNSPPGTLIVAVYNNEYCLLNHMCKGNCEIDEEEDGTVAVYTVDDVKAGEQIGSSFIQREYYINVREIRRAKLKECFGVDCNCFMCQGETVPGSKLWLFEQRKSSLIAPWSHAMARQMMVRGWELLCDSKVPGRSPSEVIEILGPGLESQNLILDRHNVILILTATNLVLTYCQINESEKAVDTYYRFLGLEGMVSLFEYGNRRDVVDITCNICIRLMDLERVMEFNTLFRLTQQFHPRRPSNKALCEMLHLTPPTKWDALSAEDWELDDEMKRECEIRADRYGIPREILEQCAQNFFDGQLTIPDFLEFQVCQQDNNIVLSSLGCNEQDED